VRRRKFLAQSGRAAVGVSILALPGCAQRNRPFAKVSEGTHWQPLIADLEQEIRRLMGETVIPGLSIAVIQDAKLVWRRGFGLKDSALHEPVDNNTVFEAGSMSKPVFAYAVFKLCEKGVMDLDTPLTRYTSERFLEGDDRLELITARHVLSHTSGFQNWRSDEKPLKIHFTPGEQYRYSGEGYSYLQSVVARVTGQPIEPFVRANLFVPFAMNFSSFVWNDTFEKHASRPHDRDGKPLEKKKPSDKGTGVTRYGAAGGLHTTPTDYAKFLIEVMDPKPSDAFRLKKSTIEEMLRPHIKTNDEFSSSWALGWQVQQSGVVNHGGYNKGFVSHAVFSPKTKTGFVVMTNGDNGGHVIKSLLLGELIQRLLAADKNQ
jgi:CubicO group peptidase (beta-lactamase class C family)